ncbi:hypothetical protein NPIL_432261 [Nephila pilipes]|uniref:Uncharacterized protein n=1 Tax=Nephila pilipes TaxID=299642 RepID=A0A8X6QLD0_NEPPI|nr:hypothetical protein NPIL_432261 [Nephila pilipes]
MFPVFFSSDVVLSLAIFSKTCVRGATFLSVFLVEYLQVGLFTWLCDSVRRRLGITLLRGLFAGYISVLAPIYDNLWRVPCWKRAGACFRGVRRAAATVRRD